MDAAVYDLPTSVVLSGTEYRINSDWRAAIDIIAVMNDRDIDDDERTIVVLSIFYPDFSSMPLNQFQDALHYVYWFINGGGSDPDEEVTKSTNRLRLMDWNQDLLLIIAPVNRVLGFEVRAVEYFHWWSFLSAYYEIGGDCLFSQVVSIRKKRALGKKLDKTDSAFYRENREIIDLKVKLSTDEEEILEQWTK